MSKVNGLIIVAALGSAVVAFPAAAIELANVQSVCTNYFENHFGEPDWELKCLDAMQELECMTLFLFF